ncbi:MAG: hypothetical protein PHG14_06650 [Desulfobacter postgatei]|uniref:hypothetical protein n=1 Tax=Desulfobacter postgatei TaxID=2293 RepID=UPI0023F27BE0|nr:hypothetical protein [Desulfobacter postgatei]MDD4273390.1 hypothetical protein [Desulfobacter postgatei]
MNNLLDETEKTLIAQLKIADPSTQLKVACNLARAGHIDLVGLAGIPGLVEEVGKALRAEGTNLDLDTSQAVAVPLANFDARGIC